MIFESCQVVTNRSYWTYMTYKSNITYMNLMVTLCSKEGFLLDRLLAANEQKFVREGDFKENLFKKRLDYRKNSVRIN